MRALMDPLWLVFDKMGMMCCMWRNWPPGISDPEVLELANREAAPLLTADKDFGHLIFRQQRLAVGIVLIRLSDLPSAHRSPIVAAAIQEHAHEIQGAFTVIGPVVSRVRRLTV